MSSVQIERHLDEAELAAGLTRDVRAGLSGRPKALPPKYFYDARGSELFEEITRLPEYYPTRAERAILETYKEEIAKFSGADSLVELGSGSAEKARLLLGGMQSVGTLRRYVPFDVSESALVEAVSVLSREFPAMEIHAVVGDFERHLSELPRDGRRLLAFLGGTIGNLTPGERARFLGTIRANLGEHDAFLLGTDLVKDPNRLVAAYDDAAGVTAEFNRNVLRVVNRSLGADFDVDTFEHVAVWDAEQEWIEMRLRSVVEQSVLVADLGLTAEFLRGEEMRTEISAKFRPEGLKGELSEAGLELAAWWTDPAGDFALSLSVPA
ncbi:L-histidine N(alpha)-methyltransferase [Flindersiella endophytica]